MSTLTAKARPDVLVVGGGAAGMLAALFAVRSGASVLLLEKNDKLGRKIYITGKGRCNVTDACEIDEFLHNVPENPRFLYGALHLLPPSSMMALLEDAGCPLKIERGNRVFPVSDKASDITKTIARALEAAGCAIRLNAPVKALLVENGAARGVELESGERIAASSVIVATGGLSYPSTGSTGDGLRFARETGHQVTPLLPSLVPLTVREEWVPALQGLSLKNVCLNAIFCGKMIYCELGEMLFTHFGLSGPLAIELSSHMAGLPAEDVQVALDMKPALSREQLKARFQREFALAGKKRLRTVLCALLPERMAELFSGLCGIDGEKCVSQVSAAERDALIEHLKALRLTVTGTRPIAEAIITRGGVDVSELSPKTMESLRVKNLYFAGEMLDTDAHTGGFNLQIAFSTGALAGKSAAERIQSI